MLITHSDQGLLQGLLLRLVTQLNQTGFLTDNLTMPHGGAINPNCDCDTYMGVCRVDADRPHRRIDLKVYSQYSYPFAVLYFTGSDHFNRSMRYYAKQKQLSLSDQGLKPVITSKGRKREKVWTGECIQLPKHEHSERGVFKLLGLRYVPPTERGCGKDFDKCVTRE